MPASLPVRAVRKARRVIVRRRSRERPDTPARAAERLLSPRYPEALLAEPAEVSEPVAEPEDQAPGAAEPLDAARELAAATRLVGALTPATAERLRAVLAVVVVTPGSRSLGLELLPGDVLVVERAALQSGPWTATETSTGTALLLEILEWFGDARENGAAIIVLDSVHAPNVGTNLLRTGADMVLPRTGAPDPVLGPVPMSPVVSLLDRIARAAVEGDR